MALIKKGNRELKVNDIVVDKYLNEGYDVIDEKGTVIKKAVANKNVDIAEFNKLIEEKDAEIAKLTQKIESLIQSLKKKEDKESK